MCTCAVFVDGGQKNAHTKIVDKTRLSTDGPDRRTDQQRRRKLIDLGIIACIDGHRATGASELACVACLFPPGRFFILSVGHSVSKKFVRDPTGQLRVRPHIDRRTDVCINWQVRSIARATEELTDARMRSIDHSLTDRRTKGGERTDGGPIRHPSDRPVARSDGPTDTDNERSASVRPSVRRLRARAARS